MVPPWDWYALSGMAIALIFQWAHLYRIRSEARNRDELFRLVTENAADMIALVDVKGRRLYNSPAYKRILGYSAAELGETSSFEQIHPDDRFKVLEAAREARATGSGRRLEYRVRHKDGSWRVLESVATAVRDNKGEVTKLVIVNRDITERKRAQEQLEHNSFHDALTGLPNRRLLLDRLRQLGERSRRHPECQYAVMVIDMDGFRRLNESVGSALGDQVLVEVGHRLEACLREEDTISRSQNGLSLHSSVLSRIGGDEFTILLEGVHDPSDAMRAASRILSAVAEPMMVQGGPAQISVSVGIALSASPEEHLEMQKEDLLQKEDPLHEEDLLQQADTAMRRAKALGGNRCELFSEAMHSRAVGQLRLEAELREALAKHQFRVYYQPILDLKSGQITCFEALLRWQHPQQGLVSAYKFLATAEHAGLLASAGQWVIAEACRQLQAWALELPSAADLAVSTNISGKQLADAHFIAELEHTLHQTGIEPSLLRLEMPETVAAADPRLNAAILSNLKRLRVGIILDDFGAGNSSLIGLRRLPVEAVKIDRALVNAMLLDRAAADIVELIVMLAHKLKLQVIAEGIESARQLEHLQALGCELGQGYFFSPPVDAASAWELLNKNNSLPQPKAIHAGG
jgi:PAS domain S-box-containing protein/diguanylate cyclase (GGDEF)-like protein